MHIRVAPQKISLDLEKFINDFYLGPSYSLSKKLKIVTELMNISLIKKHEYTEIKQGPIIKPLRTVELMRMWTSTLLFSTLILCGCASALMVQSEPPQADVYIAVVGQTDKVKVGQTPLELSELKIEELLKISPDNSMWIELTLEKKDHQKTTALLPSNRWGEQKKLVKLTLPPMDSTSTAVQKILKHLFNAKKFAESKQYDLAHAEVDKVIQMDSEMPQALNMKAGIYFLQGQTTEAQTLYKKVLVIDPGFNDAIQMLEKIQHKNASTP